MVGKKWLAVLVGGFVILCVGVGILVGFSPKEETHAKYPDRGVPKIEIELNRVSLEEVDGGSKEAKYEGNEVRVYDGDEVLAYSDVEVKGRGNGTWTQEKKPYQIKLDKKADLLGMGKARKWVLLANAMDNTSLRTAMAFYVEDMLGMKYKMEGRPVELYVDGEYRGLYYLTQAVEVGKGRVDLKDSFGVLVELDNLYGGNEINYLTGDGDILTVKDAVDSGREGEAMAEFVRTYNEFEMAVTEQNYEKISELVDIDSFVQYYLLSEFSVNPDAYWTSFYMYKDGSSDKIHAGPGWDFDLTFANRAWANWMGERFYSPTETMVRRDETRMPKEFYEIEGIENGYETGLVISKIMYNLMEVPEFSNRVKEMFKEKMSGREEEFLNMMYRERSKIQDALAFDEERWGKGNSLGEFLEMTEWVKKRYEYFEQLYGSEEIYVDNGGDRGVIEFL